MQICRLVCNYKIRFSRFEAYLIQKADHRYFKNWEIFNSLIKYCGKYFKVLIINPFKPNGISYHYQMEQSTSILRGVGWYFSFLFKFWYNICEQTVETLIRCCTLQHLIWISTVCPCPSKRTLGLYGLNGKHTAIYIWLACSSFSLSLGFSYLLQFNSLPMSESFQDYSWIQDFEADFL